MGLADAVRNLLEAGEAQMLRAHEWFVLLRVGETRLHLEEAAHANEELPLLLERLEYPDVVVFRYAAVRPHAARRGDAVAQRFRNHVAERSVHVRGKVRHAPNGVVHRRLLTDARWIAVLVANDDAAFWVGGVFRVPYGFESLGIHPADVHVP